MRKKRATKKVAEKPSVKWQKLIVARSESLPKGVYCLFVSSAHSAASAAKRKATSIGIPGGLTVVKQYPLKESGQRLFREMVKNLKNFPYGESGDFVRASMASISQKYSQLSNKYPDQTELRGMILQSEVDEKLRLLDDIKKKDAELRETIFELRKSIDSLETEEKSLVQGVKNLQQKYNKLVEKCEQKEYEFYEFDDMYAEKARVEDENEELKSIIRDMETQQEVYENWMKDFEEKGES